MKEYVEERNGGLYLAGTRISLDAVVYAHREGLTPEEITEDYPFLTVEQVSRGLEYYLAHRTVVDAYLIVKENWIEEMRRNAPPLPADLRARLEAARARLRSEGKLQA